MANELNTHPRPTWRPTMFACVLALIIGSPAAAVQVSIRPIALSGQPAPGGDGTYSNFWNAKLNDAGQVAFSAEFTGAGGGIFRGDGGPVTQIARFPILHGYFLNASGEVAFTSPHGIGGPPGTENIRGVFRYDGQTLTEIVREGQPLPGGDGVLSASGAAGFNDAGQVAFYAKVGLDEHAFFIGDGASVTEIVRSGQPAPDGNGTFAHFNPVKLNNSGHVALFSYFNDSSSGGLNDHGIVLSDGQALSQIARRGQLAPDGDGIFADFPLASETDLFNDMGQVAFPVELVGASSGHSRIYRGDGAIFTEIARQGQAVPDGNGIFTGFETLQLNDAGHVAFVATLPGRNIDSGPHRGLYFHDGSNVTEIVRSGLPGPGGRGSVVYIDSLTLNDAGQMAFILADFNEGAYGGGMYLFDGTDLVEILRGGELFDVGGGDLRTIEHVFSGPLLNSRGQVAFSATFTDGTAGVFLATISDTLFGDYNGNGTVEQADLDLVLLNWGTGATPPPLGWLNNLPSGLIDQDELDGVLLNWGSALAAKAQAAAVPEPASVLLVLVAIAAITAALRHSSPMSTIRIASVLAVGLITILLLPTPGAAEIRYDVTDLGTLGGQFISSSAVAINDSDQIVGVSTNGFILPGLPPAIPFEAVRGFTWDRAGGMQDLGLLEGFTRSYANAVNESGLAVGGSDRLSFVFPSHAFVWEEGVGMKDIGTLFSGEIPLAGVANGINDSGYVVGTAGLPSQIGNVFHGFIWDPVGGMQQLDGIERANAINNLGQIVGQASGQAVLWDPVDGLLHLPSLPAHASSRAQDINNNGHVVGWATRDEGLTLQIDTAFIWQDGMSTPLESGGLHSTFAHAINNAGQIVGRARVSGEIEVLVPTNQVALLWEGGELVALNDLIDPDSGWWLQAANDISDRGHIVGHGLIGDQVHGFLLTPRAKLLSGDYNNNGTVEQADLDLVLLNWGADATTPPVGWLSDLPSGAIDQDELDRVLLNWGSSLAATAPAAAVPEPTSVALLLAPIAAIVAAHRRSSAGSRKPHSQQSRSSS